MSEELELLPVPNRQDCFYFDEIDLREMPQKQISDDDVIHLGKFYFRIVEHDVFTRRYIIQLEPE